jgi:transcription initiation factor IIF auxiliary subunit
MNLPKYEVQTIVLKKHQSYQNPQRTFFRISIFKSPYKLTEKPLFYFFPPTIYI